MDDERNNHNHLHHHPRDEVSSSDPPQSSSISSQPPSPTNSSIILHNGGDILCNILSYLEWYEIINCRCVSNVWKVAVYSTQVSHITIDVVGNDSSSASILVGGENDNNDNQRRQLPSSSINLSDLHRISKFIPNLQSLKINQKSNHNTTIVTDHDLILMDDDDDDDYEEEENRSSLSDGTDGSDVVANGSTSSRSCSSLFSRFQNLKELQLIYTDLRTSMSMSMNQANTTTTVGNCGVGGILQLTQLQYLNLHGNENLQWELRDLQYLPNLIDLRCINNKGVTGNILNDFIPIYGRYNTTFKVLGLSGCTNITGNLSDFSKFTNLQILFIDRTKIVGDLLRDDISITPDSVDFQSIQQIGLDTKLIYGSSTINNVYDVEHIMKVRHYLSTRSENNSTSNNSNNSRNIDCPIYPFRISLSTTSSQYYQGRIQQRLYTSEYDPPFSIEYVIIDVGNDENGNEETNGMKNDNNGNSRISINIKRRGWRWSNYLGGFGKVNWLDKEPPKPTSTPSPTSLSLTSTTTTDTTTPTTPSTATTTSITTYQHYYDMYQQELDTIQQVTSENIFGHFQLIPPTQEEYIELIHRHSSQY